MKRIKSVLIIKPWYEYERKDNNAILFSRFLKKDIKPKTKNKINAFTKYSLKVKLKYYLSRGGMPEATIILRKLLSGRNASLHLCNAHAVISHAVIRVLLQSHNRIRRPEWGEHDKEDCSYNSSRDTASFTGEKSLSSRRCVGNDETNALLTDWALFTC